MFNKIILLGNLTRDIELQYLQSGAAIGKSAIAVTRKFIVNGEKREETCFIDISFFGKTAEIAKQYLKKGSKLLVEGRLKFDRWQDNNGQNGSKHSVVVEVMQMLGDPQNQNGGCNQSGYVNQNGGYVGQDEPAQTQAHKAPPRRQDEYRKADDSKYDDNDTIPF